MSLVTHDRNFLFLFLVWFVFLVFFLINNGSLQYAFSGVCLVIIIEQVVCKPVWPLRNCQAIAFHEQHLVLSAAKAEEKPSCGTKLLPAAARKHQHEESISLWRSFLSSLGLALPLASRSVKTKTRK